MPLYLAGVYRWDKLHVSARSKFEEFGPRVREEVRVVKASYSEGGC